MSISEQSTRQTFIENHDCKVEVGEHGSLLCSTSGKLVTVVLFVLGMLMIYGSIFIIGWDLPQGRMHSSSLIWGAMVFLGGIFFQWRCLRRKKEMGVFEINREKRLVRKESVGSGYSFDYITHLRLSRDWTAIVRPGRVPPIPNWLFIHFKNGHRIRVATGRRREVNQVLSWMKDAGVPGVEWV